MGEETPNNPYSGFSLEELVDAEIFLEPKTKIERVRQGIEKFVFHNKNKVLVPACTALGAASVYLSYYALRGLEYVMKIINPYADLKGFAWKMAGIGGLIFGGGLYFFTRNYIDNKIGKLICSDQTKPGEQVKEKKNFFHKYKTPLSLVLSAAYLKPFITNTIQRINSLPIEAKESVEQNMNKLAIGIAVRSAITLGAAYLLVNAIGKLSFFKGSSIKKDVYGAILYRLSKKKGMLYLEKESKKGNIYAKIALAMHEPDIGKKLEQVQEVIAQNGEEKLFFTNQINWVKLGFIGDTYLELKENSPSAVFSMANALYPVNPERAIKLLDKLSEVEGLGIKSEIKWLRNRLLNTHNADTAEHWEDFFKIVEQEGKLQILEGSEGEVNSFPDKEFTRKNAILKKASQDRSDKFFSEVAIYRLMRGTGVLVEHPLFIYSKDGIQKQVFVRSGEKNLRQLLEGVNESDRRKYFENAIDALLTLQETVFSALEKTGTEFALQTEYRGEKRRIIIPVIDREKELMRRAFMGSKPGETRLGNNDYLKPLINDIQAHNQLHPYRPMTTFNHGDAIATNITADTDTTKQLCVIDFRPRIEDVPYDLTAFAIDPALLELNYKSRKEKILELAMRRDGLRGMERDLVNATSVLYPHNLFCHAGANLYLGDHKIVRAMLSELLEFSKATMFEKSLLNYLKNSNARHLI